jgi:hypothetical protein
MRTHCILATALSGVLASILPAQTAPVPTQDPSLASHPEQAVAGAPPAIQLRSLQAVLDARERRQDWHAAAQQAADRVQTDVIKAQLTQRLSGVAPLVAKALVAHPQENALVEVNVFNDASGKQAMASVTFDGLGSDLGSDFLPGVLADVIKAPDAEGVPQGLTYDANASSFLVFFLGNKGLQAGDIPQPKMKQSIIAASNHQRDLAAHQDQVALERAKLQQDTAAAQQQATDQAQQASAVQPQIIPEFPYQDYSANDGYYYPGVGVPIVITGDGFANTPEWRARQRHREEGLERKFRQSHRQSAQGNGSTAGNSSGVATGGAGVNTPAGSAGIATTPGSAGVQVPPGSAGVATTPGPAGVATTPGSAGVATTPGSEGVATTPGSAGVANTPGSAGVNTPPARDGVQNSQNGGATRTPPAPPAAHEAPAPTHEAPAAGGGAAGGGAGPAPASSGGKK